MKKLEEQLLHQDISVHAADSRIDNAIESGKRKIRPARHDLLAPDGVKMRQLLTGHQGEIEFGHLIGHVTASLARRAGQ